MSTDELIDGIDSETFLKLAQTIYGLKDNLSDQLQAIEEMRRKEEEGYQSFTSKLRGVLNEIDTFALLSSGTWDAYENLSKQMKMYTEEVDALTAKCKGIKAMYDQLKTENYNLKETNKALLAKVESGDDKETEGMSWEKQPGNQIPIVTHGNHHTIWGDRSIRTISDIPNQDVRKIFKDLSEHPGALEIVLGPYPSSKTGQTVPPKLKLTKTKGKLKGTLCTIGERANQCALTINVEQGQEESVLQHLLSCGHMDE